MTGVMLTLDGAMEVGVTGGIEGIGANVVPTVEGRVVMVAGGEVSSGLGRRGLICRDKV